MMAKVTDTADPIGGPLVLRHASKRCSGTWGPDDWDIIGAHGRDIGRIFKASGGVPKIGPGSGPSLAQW
jgi:hypothetical protein